MSEEEVNILSMMKSDRNLITQVQSLRTQAKISLRQPLGNLYSSQVVNFPEIFMNELNIKNISNENSHYENSISNEDNSLVLDLSLTKELISEGKVRDFVRKVQDLRKLKNLDVSTKISVTYSETDIDTITLNENLDFSEILKKTDLKNI